MGTIGYNIFWSYNSILKHLLENNRPEIEKRLQICGGICSCQFWQIMGSCKIKERHTVKKRTMRENGVSFFCTLCKCGILWSHWGKNFTSIYDKSYIHSIPKGLRYKYKKSIIACIFALLMTISYYFGK